MLWDIFIVVLLLIVCIIIPWRVTFIEHETRGTKYTFIVVDVLFLIDMILTFFTTVLNDKNFEIITHKAIAKEYLTGWFLIDLISIFPLDEFGGLM